MPIRGVKQATHSIDHSIRRLAALPSVRPPNTLPNPFSAQGEDVKEPAVPQCLRTKLWTALPARAAQSFSVWPVFSKAVDYGGLVHRSEGAAAEAFMMLQKSRFSGPFARARRSFANPDLSSAHSLSRLLSLTVWARHHLLARRSCSRGSCLLTAPSGLLAQKIHRLAPGAALEQAMWDHSRLRDQARASGTRPRCLDKTAKMAMN